MTRAGGLLGSLAAFLAIAVLPATWAEDPGAKGPRAVPRLPATAFFPLRGIAPGEVPRLFESKARVGELPAFFDTIVRPEPEGGWWIQDTRSQHSASPGRILVREWLRHDERTGTLLCGKRRVAGQPEQTLDPPQPVLEPVPADGSPHEWTWRGHAGDLACEARFRAAGRETVSLPGRTVEGALRLEEEVVAANGDRVARTVWLGQGEGPVQERATIRLGSQTLVLDMRLAPPVARDGRGR